MSPEDEAYEDEGVLLRQIMDSKKLTPKRREMLADYIHENAIEAIVTWAEPEEIDRINILQADMAAMNRALDAFETPFQRVLVDGDVWMPAAQHASVPALTIVEGDAQSLAIAAASVIAKVAHDRWVRETVVAEPELDERYGFSKNMGYGTVAHIAGLGTWGAHSLHRRSFAPVRRVLPPVEAPQKRPLFRS